MSTYVAPNAQVTVAKKAAMNRTSAASAGIVASMPGVDPRSVEVILQGDLLERQQTVPEDGLTYARVHKSGVVGDSLKWDPYGFLMRSGDPMYETVNRAVIGVATDSSVREALEAEYLRVEGADEQGARDHSHGGDGDGARSGPVHRTGPE